MNNYFGIFDSGIGGLTVLKRILQRHGDLPCVYLADTARVPFGERSPSEIRFIATELVDWLREQNVSMIVMACNTTNSLALDVVQKVSGVRVFDLINSAAKMINHSRIGVLATPATVSAKAYSSAIKSIKPDAFVLEQGCPAFVRLIESGYLKGDEVESAAKKYLKPLLEEQVDTIVLGCSHYPFLEPLLRDLIPGNVQLVDPAKGLAVELDNCFGSVQIPIAHPIPFANTRFCVTSDSYGFSERVKALMGNSPEVELISLRSKSCFF